MTTTFERIGSMLVKDYQLNPDALTPDSALDELGIDSLGVAELMFNVEDEFKITLPPEAARLATVGDVVHYIDGLVAAQHGVPVPGGLIKAPLSPAA